MRAAACMLRGGEQPAPPRPSNRRRLARWLETGTRSSSCIRLPAGHSPAASVPPHPPQLQQLRDRHSQARPAHRPEVADEQESGGAGNLAAQLTQQAPCHFPAPRTVQKSQTRRKVMTQKLMTKSVPNQPQKM